MVAFTASQLFDRGEGGRSRQSQVGHAAYTRFIFGTELHLLIGHLPAILKIMATVFALLQVYLQLVNQISKALDFKVTVWEKLLSAALVKE